MLMAAGVSVYAPGLHGVFVFDSVERVVRSESLRMDSPDIEQLLGAAYAAQASYPQRGLAYISLALNYYFAGQHFSPFAFKATNLAIHILNGVLVFFLARLIFSRWCRLGLLSTPDDPSNSISAMAIAVMAIVAMALWTLHPIQLTSVLYVVQRMTSLAATWVLAGAILFVLARARFEQGRRFALGSLFAALAVCTGVGFLCKQSALLLPALIAVLELFLFDRSLLSPAQKHGLRWFFGATLLLPVTLGVALLVAFPEVLVSGYDGRDFDMLQRLLSEARVLFFYLSLLLIPDVRRFGLYHDDVVISTGLLDPAITLVAVIAWAVVVIAIVWGARRRAPWAFAGAWFLVGHAMESTIVPLELVHEHRNYVPSVAISIALVYYAAAAWQKAGRLRGLVPAALGLGLLALAFVTHARAESWRDAATLMASLSRNHPSSYRSAVGYAFNSVPRNADISLRFDAFRRAATLDGRVVVPLIEMAKVATALDNFLAGGEPLSRPRDAKVKNVPMGELQLLADRSHNAGLLVTIDAEIQRRLSRELLRIDSIAALIGVVDCGFSGNRECIALRDSARRWHDAALSQGRMPADFRAPLELSLAKISVAAGDYDRAVSHAQKAGALVQGNLELRLQEATLYALLERWDALGLALDQIEGRFPVRAGADQRFRDFRALLDSARRRSSD